MPYKYSWNPKLSKYLHQTIKPDWTTEDLYRELLSCPEIIALNSCGTEVQFDQPSEECELISCEPPVQCAGPSLSRVPTTPARANARKTPRTPSWEMSAKRCNHEDWVDFQS
jgi:hypothetical protein